MEIIQIIFSLLFVVTGIGLSAAIFICWLGMHNNTAKGNSFRMLIPFIEFDKSEFTEKGNYWRLLYWKVFAMYVVWAGLCYVYFKYLHNPATA